MTVDKLLKSLEHKEPLSMDNIKIYENLKDNEFHKEHKIRLFDDMLIEKGFGKYRREIYEKLIDYLDTDQFNVSLIPIFRYNDVVVSLDFIGLSLDEIVNALSNNKVVVLHEPIFRANEIYIRSEIIGLKK